MGQGDPPVPLTARLVAHCSRLFLAQAEAAQRVQAGVRGAAARQATKASTVAQFTFPSHSFAAVPTHLIPLISSRRRLLKRRRVTLAMCKSGMVDASSLARPSHSQMDPRCPSRRSHPEPR